MNRISRKCIYHLLELIFYISRCRDRSYISINQYIEDKKKSESKHEKIHYYKTFINALQTAISIAHLIIYIIYSHSYNRRF